MHGYGSNLIHLNKQDTPDDEHLVDPDAAPLTPWPIILANTDLIYFNVYVEFFFFKARGKQVNRKFSP